MGFSSQEYWSGLPFPSPVDHILSDLSTMTCPSWHAPRTWLSFIELDSAVVLVWLDWLVFCDYGFSVSALWCPLATPMVLLGFLLPWAWGISLRLLQQSAAAALYLGRGVPPHCRPSWPSTWDSSSRPSCTREARAPWTWGWSSWPLLLASGVGAWGSMNFIPVTWIKKKNSFILKFCIHLNSIINSLDLLQYKLWINKWIQIIIRGLKKSWFYSFL